jgi:uncharacterized protein (DUF2062 family)
VADRLTPPAAPARGLVRRRIVDPLVALLRQGITPERLALSLAVGAAVGVFPVLGTTTALCAAIALALRLNIVAIQVANYAVYPLQLVLLIPFVRIGERVLGAEPLPLALGGIVELFRQGLWHALTTLSTSIGHAVVGWALVGPAAAAVLYAALRPVLRRAAATRAGRRISRRLTGAYTAEG